MDLLGGYFPPPPGARALGNVVFAGILLLVALLERLQYRLKADEGARWWASNGRDVINLFALATLGAGLWLLGFRGPLILLIAGSMVVLLTALQSALGTTRAAGLRAGAGALALGLPVLMAPAELAQGALALVARLCP